MGQKLPPQKLELHKRIDEVLFYKWDPIGISDSDWARDEYQSYLPQVFKLALENNTPEPIANYLTLITTENMGLSEKISTCCCSMDNLPFVDEEYDVIWSEGAIYNIGFERGVKDWNRYLKVSGLLVASEITWIASSRPSEIQKYWDEEYPEIDLASSKIHVLEKNGYSPIGYFVLPEHCWLENYYRPMQNSFEDFLNRHGKSEEAREIVEAENREIELYERYKAHYSYGVYIAKKLD